MKKIVKLPRKIKKELKKLVLKPIDTAWKSKEVKIQRVSRENRFRNRSNSITYKGLTVISHQLG